MQLQNFQPKARITGDKMDLRNYYGRPLLVRVNEYVPDFTSQKYPNPKPVVFVDVVDLMSGSIFINALWGGGAVVDNLMEYAGTEVVLPLVANEAQGATNKYISLAALDDNTAAMAAQWANANWGVVEQTRQQRMAAAQAAQPMQQQAPQNQFQQQPAAQPGFAPIGVQGQPAQVQQQAPAQSFGGPVQGFQGQPNQQGQFQQAPNNLQPTAPQGQPMQGFGQPAPQQAPAAQGWAPPAQAPVQQPGMFSDAQPPMQQGQGFGAPQGGVDQAAAQAALQQLNGQIS
jgi:hypothetical protein